VREFLKRSPAFRRLNAPLFRALDSGMYNLRHDPLTHAELGDKGRTDKVKLFDPMGLARDTQGALYVSDRGGFVSGRVIWRFGPDGTADVIAGTGRRGIASSDDDAREADLGSPQGVCVDTLGRVYFADSYNHVILRIERNGALARVAGTGMAGSSGDGGPATEAELNQPYDVRLDDAGNLYIADFGNHRIRKVDPAGIMTTVAGMGEPGYAGDGGSATAARLHGPYGVFADSRHGLLIADSENNVVRQVDSTGTIRTIAGTGRRGRAGDEGPAVAATFDSPQGLYVDGRGLIYVGDEHNHEIRVITADGVVHRLAGNGASGVSPDDTPAESGGLSDVENMVVTEDGQIVFTEAGHHLVRIIDGKGLLHTLVGQVSPDEGS
jgi:hypothetical protein